MENSTQLIHVLDSTVFIGLDFPILQSINAQKFVTTHSVIDELKDFRSKMNLDIMRQESKLEVIVPDLQALKLFKKRLRKIDPNTRLSETDIQVLALSYQLNGVVVTNDLALQNVAAHLNLKTRILSGKEIKEIRKTQLRCRSCKKVFRTSILRCPDCGGELKQFYSKDILKE